VENMKLIKNMDNIFIFLNMSSNDTRHTAMVFQDPVALITCDNPDEIEGCFNNLDKALSEGFFVAGFLAYELGYHFLEIPFDKRSPFPLLCFGIFESLTKMTVDKFLSLLSEKAEHEGFQITNDSYSVLRDKYYQDIAYIKSHLRNGNTYQVNHTFKYKFDFNGSPEAFFTALLKRQKVPYAGFVQLDRWAILSLSPELFFQRDDKEIIVRPMKGTMERGQTPMEDESNSRFLENSIKNRSENIMIVDLMRNDLGKISETGSVRPDGLFSIEKYNTLFQMTSTIRSDVKKGISWHRLFKEIFPSGSVTGAPKKRTMEIIKDVEEEERNIYTGSIGYILPDGQSLFNVAIRTALIDKDTGKAEMGIGSGVIYDSEPEKEYDECLLKGSFLTGLKTEPDFDLIETMLWEKGIYFLLDLHLKRLEESARHFSYPFDKNGIVSSLKSVSGSLDQSKTCRIRLLLNKAGKCKISHDTIDDVPEMPVKVTISDKRTSRTDTLLQHKTTNRWLYDREHSKYRENGFFDVLFFNSDGELTEGAITNVIIKKEDELFTPPLSCGALAGVYREFLLHALGVPIKEKVLYLEDLKKADEIFLTNSVRKLIPAILSE